MYKFLIPLLLIVATSLADAQHVVYKMTDVVPQYFKGEDALNQYLSDSLKFPADSIYASLDVAVVVVRFFVYEDGSIGDFKIIRTEGDAFSDEAIRVLKNSGLWIPGHNNGGPAVTTQYQLPVIFHKKHNN